MNETPLKVFISYKWEDEAHNEWVKKFATDLRAAGIDAKLDRWEVRLGDSFTKNLRMPHPLAVGMNQSLSTGFPKGRSTLWSRVG
jgi:hypothetical protein